MLVFVSIHWLLLFSDIPQGLRLLERAVCLNCCVRGKCWLCLGRSEQSPPLQAFLQQNLMIWVTGWVSKWVRNCIRAFLAAAAEYLLAGLPLVLFCSLSFLFLLMRDMGGLWMVHRMHKPVSSYDFLNLFIRCVLRRGKWEGIVKHPQSLQFLQHRIHQVSVLWKIQGKIGEHSGEQKTCNDIQITGSE